MPVISNRKLCLVFTRATSFEVFIKAGSTFSPDSGLDSGFGDF